MKYHSLNFNAISNLWNWEHLVDLSKRFPKCFEAQNRRRCGRERTVQGLGGASCVPPAFQSTTGQGLRESQPSRAATVSWPTLRKWTSADQRAAGATEYGWKSDPEQKFQEPQRRNRARPE